MFADTEYIDIFQNHLAGHAQLEELATCRGMQAIQKHATQTSNVFEIAQIKDALKGAEYAGYGLRNLKQNLQSILDFVGQLPLIWPELIEVVEREVKRLFPSCDLSQTILCPVIGYDIGIGVNQTICLNLNNTLFLEDSDEFIALAIHEATHTVFEQIISRPVSFGSLIDAQTVLRFAEYLIQYEGVGLIAAAGYRKERNLRSGPFPTTQDYATSPERLQYYLENYHNLIKQIQFGAKPGELLELIFNGERLVHRLGYDLFARIEQEEGFEAVRSAAQMPIEIFTNRYLRHNPWFVEPFPEVEMDPDE